MIARSLYARIAMLFAIIVLTLGASLSWLGYRAAKQHQHEVLQRVSLGMARQITGEMRLIDAGQADLPRTDAVFEQLMAVNPNVEIYLLDAQGKVLRTSPADAPLARERIDVAPLRALLDDAPLPVLAENPRQSEGREIFSVAPIGDAKHPSGYVYIVLLNDMYREMVGAAWKSYVLHSGTWIALLAVGMALLTGLVAFALLTRRLERLTHEVESFASETEEEPGRAPAPRSRRGNEIDRLASAFDSMRRRLQAQMSELKRQDELRRELVANVSHDLRTPLTSMRGYLETLQRFGKDLSGSEQRDYLDVAVRQSHKVSHLVQQLFELARLECEEVMPHEETFSVAELVQDIAQKYALTAQDKGLKLRTRVESDRLLVVGDIGMIERVISNLLDNAVRHTPQDGAVSLEVHAESGGIEICVSDTGKGIADDQLPGLLERGSPLRMMAVQRGGGLGLLIAKRILSMHGSRIRATSKIGEGTRISFVLRMAEAA